MREYGKFQPRFWTGETGRMLKRMGGDAQLVAVYLFTCPSANMLGIFNLPLPLLSHHVALSDQAQEAPSKALRRVCETGFAFWDEESETIFIPRMAAIQLGETVSEKDNMHKAIVKELHGLRKSPFAKDFYELYKDAYHLPEMDFSKPLRSPSEAPSKALRSTETEIEIEGEIDLEMEREAAAPRFSSPPKATAPRAEKFNPLTVEFPAVLREPSFAAAWEKWISHRRELRAPNHRETTVAQLEFLAKLGLPSAVEWLETAVRSGWKNLYPPGPASNGRAGRNGRHQTEEEMAKEALDRLQKRKVSQ